MAEVGNDMSPDAPADEINDGIRNGPSESAPPDFDGTFAAFERTREADERTINRVLGQAAVYQFPAIEGYNPYADPNADQDLVDRYLPRFLDVRSPDACRAMEYRLKREENEAELVCSSGWMGAVAAASIGRPALATWIPDRVEYVAGELKYRPGHATLGYGFPEIDFASFGGGGGGGGHGGGDRRKSKRPIDDSIPTLDVIEVRAGEQPPPPPPDAPGGRGTPYDPPATHDSNTRVVENVEAPRVEPPPADAEALGSRQPAVEPVAAPSRAELPSLAPEIPEPAASEGPNPEPPRVAGSDPEQITTEQPAHAQSTSAGASTRPGWVDQFKLSQTAAEYSSIEGAGRLYRLATVAKWLEENPDAKDHDLLTQFAPGLLGIRWAERRQVMVDYLRSAPTLLEDVRQKQAAYEAMESSGSFGDFTAWLAGQAIGGWKSPETWVGGAGKGASLLGRALWTGLKQAGVSAASDAVAQWLLVKAGFQKEFNPVQTATSAVAAGVFSAAGKAGADGVKLGIASKFGPPEGKKPLASEGKAPVPPEGKTPVAEAPLGARVEEPGPVAVERPVRVEPKPVTVEPKGEAPNVKGKKALKRKQKRADLQRRVADVEKMAAEKPVSERYEGAKVGHADRNDYARTFHEANKDLDVKVEVHHAIEQNVLEWYPGLFTKREIHSLENLRGIPKTEYGSALHRSIIRKAWNEFRDNNPAPTKQQVIDFATSIDRKYGGLFKPPL